MASMSLVFDLLARDKASPEFRKVGDAAEKAGKKTHGFGTSVGGAMKLAAGAIAAAGLGRAFAGFITDAAESQKIGRLTAAVIKSTGGAANITAKQVSDLSTAISNKTAIDDEAIQSASNLLLTFTNVRNEVGKGNDIFNQATQAATDMAVALGKEPKDAAIQLGKALNDPVKGVTALAKAGVSFTAQQKEQIKTMVESGDTLGAQKIVLKELGREFGGAAEAASTPMDKLRVVAGNLGEQIGGALLPIIGDLSSFVIDKVVPAVQDLWQRLKPVGTFIKDNLTPIIVGLSGILLVMAGPAVLGALTAAFGFLTSPVLLVAGAIAGVVAIFTTAYRQSKPLRDAVDALKGAFKTFFDAFKGADAGGGVSGFFERVGAGIKAAWPGVKSALADIAVALWEWIKDAIGPALAALRDWAVAVGGWFLSTGLPWLANAAAELGSALWGWISDNIGPALKKLGEWGKALLEWVWNTGLPMLGKGMLALGGALIGWIGPRVGPALKAIGGFLGDLVGWLWSDGLPMLWDALVGLGSALVDWIGPKIPDLLKNLAGFLGRAVGWIISTGIPMLVGGLLYLAYKLVAWIVPQIPTLLKNLAIFLGRAVKWIITDGIPMLFHALWDMGVAAIKGLWQSIEQSPLYQKIAGIFQTVIDWVKEKWDKLKGIIAAPWNWLKEHVFSPMAKFITVTLPGYFQTGIDGIVQLWNDLKDLLKKPIQWVIDVVWNNGIRALWNKVNNLWGGDDLATFKLATGGVLPGYTPGRDVHTFVSPTGGVLGLSGGEAVMRPEWTRAFGKPTIDYWNKVARTEGEAGLRRVLANGDPQPRNFFADGGVVGLGKRALGWLPPSWMQKLIGGPMASVSSVLTDYVAGEKSALSSGGGNGLVGGAIVGTITKAANSIWTWIKDKVSGLLEGAESLATGTTNPGGPGISTDRAIAALTWARGQVGKPYIWGGVGPGGYDCSGLISALANIVRGNSPYSRVGNTSSMPWAGFRTGLSGPFQVGSSDNTGGGIGHMAATLMGVNVESAGGIGVRIGSSARGANSSIFPEHYSMTYDQGGILPPGYTLAYNGTGRNEYVTKGGAPEVHVYIGDRELTDIVDVRIVDAFDSSTSRSRYNG